MLRNALRWCEVKVLARLSWESQKRSLSMVCDDVSTFILSRLITYFRAATYEFLHVHLVFVLKNLSHHEKEISNDNDEHIKIGRFHETRNI